MKLLRIFLRYPKPNISEEWLAILLRITEVPGLSLGQDIGAPSLPQRNPGIVLKNLLGTPPSIPYPLNHSQSSHH